MAYRVKLELSPDYTALYGVPSVGSPFRGGVVVVSFPPDPNIIIEKEGDEPWQAFDAQLTTDPAVVDQRPEHGDYTPRWIPPHPSQINLMDVNAVFDSAPLLGVSDETQKRGRYGAEGVLLLVADTGYDPGHIAFDGKSVYWWSVDGGAARDDNQHGTWCLSRAGSAWGVATDAPLGMFRCLPGGRGSESGVAQGIQAAADYAQSQRRPAVLSLSLGGSHSSVIAAAVGYAAARGVLCVCAAGNDGPSAAIGSPADAPEALVVGAIDRALRVTNFSSGGRVDPKVRVYAPGLDEHSAQAGTREGVLTVSGTSMATPAVAGCAALLAASGMTFEQIRQYIDANQVALQPSVDHSNGRGCLRLQPDFGEGGKPVPKPSPSGVADRLRAIQAECDRDDLRHTKINPACESWTNAQIIENARANEAFAADIQARLGIIHEHATQALQELDEDPSHRPPPTGRVRSDPFTTLAGFAFDAHWLGSQEGKFATDWYPDPAKSGASENLPISWPVAGTVRRSAVIGPLSLRSGAIADCVPGDDDIVLPEGTALYTAILEGDDGWTYGFTHVRGDIIEGRANAGEVFAYTDSSGVESFRPLKVAHIHFAGGTGHPQGWSGMQGNVAAAEILKRLNFKVEIRPASQEPSPMDYQAGRAFAGAKR